MNLLKNNQLLKQAFIEADRQLLSQYDDEGTLDWVPSANFERKMYKLILAQKRPYWGFINITSKRVAIIALVALIIFTSAIGVKAIREPLVNTIIQIYDKFTKIIFIDKGSSKDTAGIQDQYSLSHLPKTFSEKETLTFENMFIISWENDLGERVQLQQTILVGHEYRLDTEENRLTKTNVGDIEGYSYLSKGYEYWMWHNGVYIFNLSFPQKYHGFFVQIAENGILTKIN